MVCKCCGRMLGGGGGGGGGAYLRSLLEAARRYATWLLPTALAFRAGGAGRAGGSFAREGGAAVVGVPEEEELAEEEKSKTRWSCGVRAWHSRESRGRPAKICFGLLRTASLRHPHHHSSGGLVCHHTLLEARGAVYMAARLPLLG